MSQAKLTLIGLYNYNSSLFENLILPDGIDKETVIYNILGRGGEYEVIYADFDFNKMMIKLISKKWNRTFQKWIDALNLSYDPIYNYDRFEEFTDVNTSEESSSGEGNTNNNISAYDTSNLVPNSASESKQTASSNGTDTSKHTAHLYGNIGVTTSQEMLRDELNLAEWNLYDHIADIFIDELTIPIYS